MSKSDSSSEQTPDVGGAPERDEVLSMLEDGLEEAHRKVESGRVYDAENEKVRQGWFRTLGYIAGQYRQLMKDKELEEMNERLERLENAQGIDD
ncbi:hypothetical protein DMJ13_27315 [halophilic archaeon]|nr:hypothetical protein DMJ13_27315 [halophilic archaeon]